MSSGPLAIVAGAFQTRKVPTRQVRDARTDEYPWAIILERARHRLSGSRDGATAAVGGLHEMEVGGVQMRLGESAQTDVVMAVATCGHTRVGSGIRAGV